MVGKLSLQRGLQHLPRQPRQQSVRARQLDALIRCLRDRLLREAGQIDISLDELTRPRIHLRDPLQFLAHARFSSRRSLTPRPSRRAIYTKFPTVPKLDLSGLRQCVGSECNGLKIGRHGSVSGAVAPAPRTPSPPEEDWRGSPQQRQTLRDIGQGLAVTSTVLWVLGVVTVFTGVGAFAAPGLFAAAAVAGAASTAIDCIDSWGADMTGCAVGAATFAAGGLRGVAAAGARRVMGNRYAGNVARDVVMSAQWSGSIYGHIGTAQYWYER